MSIDGVVVKELVTHDDELAWEKLSFSRCTFLS